MLDSEAYTDMTMTDFDRLLPAADARAQYWLKQDDLRLLNYKSQSFGFASGRCAVILILCQSTIQPLVGTQCRCVQHTARWVAALAGAQADMVLRPGRPAGHGRAEARAGGLRGQGRRPEEAAAERAEAPAAVGGGRGGPPGGEAGQGKRAKPGGEPVRRPGAAEAAR